jgi:hypothetical protein
VTRGLEPAVEKPGGVEKQKRWNGNDEVDCGPDSREQRPALHGEVQEISLDPHAETVQGGEEGKVDQDRIMLAADGGKRCGDQPHRHDHSAEKEPGRVAMKGLQDLVSRKLEDRRLYANRMLNHLGNGRRTRVIGTRCCPYGHYQRKRIPPFPAVPRPPIR